MTTDIELEAADFPFRVRVYPATNPDGTMLVWLHGGAFMFGSLDMPEADATARALAALGTTVASVDYTLAPVEGARHLPPPPPMEGMPTPEQLAAEMAAAGPRAPFPVASLQTVAAWDWAVENAADFGADPALVGLGGASAGGNLAAGAGMRIRDRGGAQPRVLALVYPVLHHEIPTISAELEAALEGLPDALTFPKSATVGINANYLGGEAPGPYSFPGGHDTTSLAPLLVINAERDRLRASGEAFAAEVRAGGGSVAVETEAGTLHGYLNEPGAPAARTVARIHGALVEGV